MRRKASKTTSLYVRVAPDENGAWERAAEELGVSLSQWVRTWLNHAAERDARGRLIHK